MSESKFQSLFKQMFGMSAYQYHIVAKMEEAKKFLLSNNYSVSDVGFMLGYSNLSHFTDIFKKHFPDNRINPFFKIYIFSLIAF